MANETLNIQNGVSPITIDTEVTEGSMRPVTSDGIYKAIQAGGGGGGLPPATPADLGKILRVGSDEWEASNFYDASTSCEVNVTATGNNLTITSMSDYPDLVRSMENAGRVKMYFNGDYVELPAFRKIGEIEGFDGAYVIQTSGYYYNDHLNFVVLTAVLDTPNESVSSASGYLTAERKERYIHLSPTDATSGTADITNSELVEALSIGGLTNFIIDITSLGYDFGEITPTAAVASNGVGFLTAVIYILGSGAMGLTITNGTYQLTAL